jgi:hypothetical protein
MRKLLNSPWQTLSIPFALTPIDSRVVSPFSRFHLSSHPGRSFCYPRPRKHLRQCAQTHALRGLDPVVHLCCLRACAVGEALHAHTLGELTAHVFYTRSAAAALGHAALPDLFAAWPGTPDPVPWVDSYTYEYLYRYIYLYGYVYISVYTNVNKHTRINMS